MPGGHPLAESSFGPNAEAYERGRPGWPAAALDAATERLALGRDSVVLDLAAGTGKLTRALVPRFGSVIAVEPVDGMRAVLERVVPHAQALDGTAEAIPLDDAAVDAVFVAEAFHWFDVERAVGEIRRVLRPGGGVAVLYNRHDWHGAREPWLRDCHAVFEAHRLPPGDVDPFDTRGWRDALATHIGPLTLEVFDNVQQATVAELVAQYESFSAIGGLPPDRRAAALGAVAAVLDRHSVTEVEIPYRTELVTAKRPDAS